MGSFVCDVRGHQTMKVGVIVMGSNVRGEPVFSVMAASWFCEKYG